MLAFIENPHAKLQQQQQRKEKKKTSLDVIEKM